jgi:hypothetical protein
VEKRLLLLNSKELKWYHDEEELKKGKKPLGVIYLSAVYHCVPANTKMNTVDINVSFIVFQLNIRSAHARGGRKSRKKRVAESLFSERKTSQREMSGSLPWNT